MIQRNFRSSSICDLSCFLIGSVFVLVQYIQYLHLLYNNLYCLGFHRFQDLRTEVYLS